MSILAELRERFAAALTQLVDEDVSDLVAMVKPSQDARFGDYQANCAMPLGKRLGQPPRDVAAALVEALQVGDLCQPPEIAGPGFINLTIRDDVLAARLAEAAADDRLGIAPCPSPRTYVIDYSSPNVAKPMHVGHIRSTVIGDALARTLRFQGHRVITDNHIGDWGTQFGMIIYGYKHFADQIDRRSLTVDTLARLYRQVNELVEYQKNRQQLPDLQGRLERQRSEVAERRAAPASGDPKADKRAAKALRQGEDQLAEAERSRNDVQRQIDAIEQNPDRSAEAAAHGDIDLAVLRETAALHAGDATNVGLWQQFLPVCMEEIDQIYRRLGVRFDQTLGESFYDDRLTEVVDDLQRQGLAKESDGAVCVFLEGHDTPMIVRKQDGAFLYATTDLATIQYRVRTWRPDAILYVVDHRQSLHFQQLFATARAWGFAETELEHIRFGTVLGEDGRPFKTRSGTSVGLDGLLDEAIRKAHRVVSENDDAKPQPELSAADRDCVARAVGIAALKYADLSQNRESDYVFSYDKMLALNGNTATYMQYAYARVCGILRKGEADADAIRSAARQLQLDHAAERRLALAILRFGEALDLATADYRPNHLTSYLFEELAKSFSSFFEKCPVIQAETESLRHQRFRLCDLTGRTIKLGLSLLGIDVVEQM